MLALTEFLPDTERVSNPLAQVLHDLVAPAPISHWGRRIVHTRIVHYDQIRIYATRGFLLVLLAVLLAFADVTSPLVWPLLFVGALQTALEIYVHPHFQLSDDSDSIVVRAAVRVLDWQYEQTLVNITGVLGVFAVVANLVAVLFLTGPGQPSWIKVVALDVAIAYGVSGILAVLVDATYYSPLQHLPKPITVLRPYAWLLAGAVLTLLVAWSVGLHRWDPAMAPLAWVSCALSYVIGMKTRDFDRFIRASSQVARRAMDDARARLVQDLHDNLGIQALSRELNWDPAVDREYQVKASVIASQITNLKEMEDEEAWIRQGKRLTVAGLVTRVGNKEALRLTIDLRLGELNSDNGELVRQLLTTVLTNAGQALTDQDDLDRRVTVRGRVADGRIQVGVGDPLPLIPDLKWCAPGSTLDWMRRRIREAGGDLTQERTDEGKEVRAWWPVKPPPVRRSQ